MERDLETYPPDPLPLGIYEGKGEYRERGRSPLSKTSSPSPVGD